MNVDREGVRALLLELLRRKGDRAPLQDGDPLITSGRLDSVDVLEIVAYLETKHGLDFTTRPFDPTEFDTLQQIVALQ